MHGRCTCGAIRYHLKHRPLFVHACHCTWCQRETGSAFALNAMIEGELIEVTGEPEMVMTPSASGKGQEIARCPACRVALFSHYAGSGRAVAFVRVGTLDEPGALPPDIHIFAASKQAWVELDDRVPVVPEYYDRRELWPQWALDRWQAMKDRVRGG